MATIFIYALCEPGTRTVRYIGKTTNPRRRFRGHLTKSRGTKTHLGCWLRSLEDQIPNFVILREVSEAEGSAAEIKYIRIARESLGMRLVNGTDGGDGMTPTPNTRAKVQATWTPERRAIQSALFMGHAVSEETRANQRAAWTPERRANQRAAQRTPERRAAMSRATKAAWTPERRAAAKIIQQVRRDREAHENS